MTTVVHESVADASEPAHPAAGAEQRPSGGIDRLGDPTGPRWLVEVPSIAGVLAIVAALVYRVWDRSLSVPFAHAGDYMAHVAVIESTGWTGTPARNLSLGAPYGVSWADMPNGADRAHLIVLRLLRAVTGDGVVSANLYLLLGIILAGIAAYVVARTMDLSVLAAGIAAVVFAVAPAHFARSVPGHLFLVAYYAVPICVYLAWWATRDDPVQQHGRGAMVRRLAPTVVMILVVGSASPYYAVFGVAVIGFLGLIVALRRASLRSLARPATVTAGILLVVVANVAGEAVTRGSSGEAGVRVAGDSDAYALRISQMLLPIRDHAVPALSSWTDQAFRVDAPGDRGAALGLVATIGLFAIWIWCVRFIGRSEPTTRESLLARLGLMALIVVGVATVGGVGTILATMGLTQIRAWSRMAIFVGFIGAVGAGMLIDSAFRRWSVSSVTRAGVAVLIVGVALIDQVGNSRYPEELSSQQWAADNEIAQSLQAALPDDAMVFQLPVVQFPAELPTVELNPNDHFGPFAAGDGTLRWSAGALSGREGDWQRSLTGAAGEEIARSVAAAGFSALYVDRRGIEDPDGLERQLTEALGPPEFLSADGSREWWDLRPLRSEMVEQYGAAGVDRVGAAVSRPIGVVVDGSPGIRSTRDLNSRHIGETGSIVVTDYGPDRSPVDVEFSVSGEPGGTVTIEDGGRTRTIELTDEPRPLQARVEFDESGRGSIGLRSDAEPITTDTDSSGDLRVLISGIRVHDPVASAVGMLTN